MGKKGSTKHQKRFDAPKTYSIPRKWGKFVIRGLPGAHTRKDSIPLLVIIRDIFSYAKTSQEARRILYNKSVLVDGIVRTEPKFCIGLMDVLSFPEINKNFRCIATSGRRKLCFIEISEDEKDKKLVKIHGKKTVNQGRIHYTLHDGRSIVVSKEENANWKVGDSLLIKIPDQTILDHFPREEGNLVLVEGGSNTGFMGTLEEIEKRIGRHKSLVVIRDQDSVTRTSLEYVFPIGKNKPVLQITAN